MFIGSIISVNNFTEAIYTGCYKENVDRSIRNQTMHVISVTRGNLLIPVDNTPALVYV